MTTEFHASACSDMSRNPPIPIRWGKNYHSRLLQHSFDPGNTAENELGGMSIVGAGKALIVSSIYFTSSGTQLAERDHGF